MNRLQILIDEQEVPKVVFAKRFEDFLVRGGISVLTSFNLAKDLMDFLDGYEDLETDV